MFSNWMRNTLRQTQNAVPWVSVQRCLRFPVTICRRALQAVQRACEWIWRLLRHCRPCRMLYNCTIQRLMGHRILPREAEAPDVPPAPRDIWPSRREERTGYRAETEIVVTEETEEHIDPSPEGVIRPVGPRAPHADERVFAQPVTLIIPSQLAQVLARPGPNTYVPPLREANTSLQDTLRLCFRRHLPSFFAAFWERQNNFPNHTPAKITQDLLSPAQLSGENQDRYASTFPLACLVIDHIVANLPVPETQEPPPLPMSEENITALHVACMNILGIVLQQIVSGTDTTTLVPMAGEWNVLEGDIRETYQRAAAVLFTETLVQSSGIFNIPTAQTMLLQIFELCAALAAKERMRERALE